VAMILCVEWIVNVHIFEIIKLKEKESQLSYETILPSTQTYCPYSSQKNIAHIYTNKSLDLKHFNSHKHPFEKFKVKKNKTKTIFSS
jgi:hypothetical protein